MITAWKKESGYRKGSVESWSVITDQMEIAELDTNEIIFADYDEIVSVLEELHPSDIDGTSRVGNPPELIDGSHHNRRYTNIYVSEYPVLISIRDRARSQRDDEITAEEHKLSEMIAQQCGGVLLPDGVKSKTLRRKGYKYDTIPMGCNSLPVYEYAPKKIKTNKKNKVARKQKKFKTGQVQMQVVRELSEPLGTLFTKLFELELKGAATKLSMLRLVALQVEILERKTDNIFSLDLINKKHGWTDYTLREKIVEQLNKIEPFLEGLLKNKVEEYSKFGQAVDKLFKQLKANGS